MKQTTNLWENRFVAKWYIHIDYSLHSGYVDDLSSSQSCWKQSMTDFLQYEKKSSWLFCRTVSTSSFMVKLKESSCSIVGEHTRWTVSLPCNQSHFVVWMSARAVDSVKCQFAWGKNLFPYHTHTLPKQLYFVYVMLMNNMLSGYF